MLNAVLNRTLADFKMNQSTFIYSFLSFCKMFYKSMIWKITIKKQVE